MGGEIADENLLHFYTDISFIIRRKNTNNTVLKTTVKDGLEGLPLGTGALGNVRIVTQPVCVGSGLCPPP